MVSDQQFKKERDLILRDISQRNLFQRLVALAQDYGIINCNEHAEKKWAQAMVLDKTKVDERIEYIKFCILSKQTNKALNTVANILKQ